MKRTSFIMLLGLFALIPACNLTDDEFLDSWSDESTKEFKSSAWDDVQQNEFAVRGEPDTEPRNRVFPDTGILYYDDMNETANICFRSTVEPAKEYPDQTGWDGWGHLVNLAIENIPVKITKSGDFMFSKKTQTGTLSFSNWGGCSILMYHRICDCKVSISGKLVQSESYLYDGCRLTGDIEIRILSPYDDRWILNYKELTLSTCDIGFLKMFLNE